MGCIRTETTLINGNEKSQPCDSAQDEQYGAVVARDDGSNITLVVFNILMTQILKPR